MIVSEPVQARAASANKPIVGKTYFLENSIKFASAEGCIYNYPVSEAWTGSGAVAELGGCVGRRGCSLLLIFLKKQKKTKKNLYHAGRAVFVD
jgi:hypothetical protein